MSTGKKDKILRLNEKFKLDLLIVYPNIICSTRTIYSKNRIINSIRQVMKKAHNGTIFNINLRKLRNYQPKINPALTENEVKGVKLAQKKEISSEISMQKTQEILFEISLKN